MLLLNEVITIIETNFPLNHACKWDFTGLQLCAHNDKINKVLICLDVTDSIIAQAQATKTDLIICHHPLIFAPSINDASVSLLTKKMYEQLLQADISVYALHTNFDCDQLGMNMLMAQELKISKCRWINEEKSAIMGTLLAPLPITNLITNIKKYFNVSNVQFIGSNLCQKVTTIALAAGAGGDAINDINNNIDCFITGEMKWNQVLVATANKVNVIIVGHYMEQKFVHFISNFLQNNTSQLKIIMAEPLNPLITV